MTVVGNRCAGGQHLHARVARRKLSGWLGALAVAEAFVAFAAPVPVVRPVLALVIVLGVPTLLLGRSVVWPAGSRTAVALHAFGATLLGLMLVALVLNTVLPILGIARPLQPGVLAAASFVVNAGLLLWRPRAVPPVDVRLALGRVLTARLELGQALGVAAVVLAVAGAIRLNNDAGGAVAVAALLLAAAALLTLMLRHDGTPGRDSRTLALVATSLLLGTSLRGWAITGHDIQAEFLAFKLTDGAQHWSMAPLQDAYNACLSVNVLPTVLAQITGLSGVVVFKVLLQLVFALVPVLTFLLARRLLPRRLALAAATFVVAFPTFFTDMPYIVRQEVAFFFLALMLLVSTDQALAPRTRRRVAGVFGVGVVLSHYSTTYLLLLGIGAGLFMLGGWRVAARVLRRELRPQPLVLLSPALAVFLVVVATLWAGPVTRTGGHAAEVARATVATLLGKGDGLPSSSDVSYSLFSRNDVTARRRLHMFVNATLDARQTVPQHTLLVRHPGPHDLRPAIVPRSTLPLTGAGRLVRAVGVQPSAVAAAARVGCAALLQLLLLVGLVRLLRRVRDPAAWRSPGWSDPGHPRELSFLAFGAVAALGLVVLVPNLSVEYGVLRAFQQTLLLTAPVMAVGLWTLVRPLRAAAPVLTVAVPVGLLLVLTGAATSLLGGSTPRLALANAGLYYDRYLASDADLQAMSRLAQAWDPGGPTPTVIASRNDGIRIVADGEDPGDVADRLYPTLLTRGSYIFLDSHLVRERRSTVFYSGDLITYVYPVHELDRLANLVYSAGSSRVYR